MFLLQCEWPRFTPIRNNRQNYNSLHFLIPILVAARSEASVCDRYFAGIAGSNPAAGMDVSCEYCVLSGRGLCDGLITHSEESFRVWLLCVRKAVYGDAMAWGQVEAPQERKKNISDSKLEDKRWITAKVPWLRSALISSCIEFRSVRVSKMRCSEIWKGTFYIRCDFPKILEGFEMIRSSRTQTP